MNALGNCQRCGERKPCDCKPRKNGLYWLRSERSLTRRAAQHIDGKWYTIGEMGPIDEAEIEHRGWYIGKRIKKANKP